MSAEIEALPPGSLLDQNGSLEVWHATASRIPRLLQEIGRLREITFRAGGEGTGRARDLDLYDNYYRHLFVWNQDTSELVGAYRLGLSDEIALHYGRKGLYTHTLFRYDDALIRAINPAIELGRSFVRPEYQKSYSPLLLLWKGIGRFVAANPRYRMLFGAVSISGDYTADSQRLLVEFLRATRFCPDLASHIHPRRPFQNPIRLSQLPADLDELAEMVTAIEPDGKGVPVLLRQYLKLGGQILGFNIDPKFSNTLDGLILVDLDRTDPRVLNRYMGTSEAVHFKNHRPIPLKRAS